MADIFISYARADQDMARRLADAVRALGYSVWWDQDLPPHLSYGDVITREIGSAAATIVIWSRAAAASEWVRAEADLARNARKLVQTAIDDTDPPLPFNQIQFASLAGWQGEGADPEHPGWRKVRDSLAALSGREASPAEALSNPAPPAPAPDAAAPARRPPRPWIAALAVLAAFAAAAALAFAWLGTGGTEAGPDPVPAASPAAPAGEGAPAEPIAAPAEDQVEPLAAPPPHLRPDAAPAPTAAPRPVPPRLVRWCANAGRDTLRCRRLREQGRLDPR